MNRKSGNAFFTEFLDDYFAESEDHLAAARQHLTMLESGAQRGPVDLRAVEELLRNFHSLKGLAAMVGFDEIAQIAHRLEDYLRNLKEPNAVVQPEEVEQVFNSIESIEQALTAYRKNQPGPDLRTALLALDGLGSGISGGQVPQTAVPEMPALPPLVPTPVQTWKFEFQPTQEHAANGLNVNSVREKLARIGQVIDASPRIRAGGTIAFEFIVTSDLDEQAFKQIAAGLTYTRVAADPTESTVPAQSEATWESQASGAVNLIRVDMRRLDDLMRLVGELVISRAHLDQTLDSAQKSIPPAQWRLLEEINAAIGRQLRDLRESVMRVRMVPIGQLFERMRFVLRGLERESHKHIRLEIRGHDTEIDKMIVERMMDPMLHLVRNAVSHGVETAAERVASGKPQEGLVRLTASGHADTVLIEVEDDGRGVDLDKLSKRARETGLLLEGENMDPSRVLDVISAPGFSTRETADLASGRGVGMAVVRNTIEDLGGTIALDTAAGRGTHFTIRLPLTLAIADALLVEAAGQRYALPQTGVREVLTVESSAVVAFENNEIIPYRGGVLSIIRLRRLFRLVEKCGNRFHVLVLEGFGEGVGLAVDRIVGQREIVIRGLADPFLRVPGVSGATELGDGHPVLILDPHALIRLHAERGSHGTK